MKNYDDLQRFKDKTRTGDINFKDLSAQNKQASASGWAIINQLAGVDNDSALAKAGSVAVPVPQAVKPGELDVALASLTKAPVAGPAGAAPSIMQSMNAVSAEKGEQSPINPAAPSFFDQLKPEPTSPPPVKEVPALVPQAELRATPAPVVPIAEAVPAPKPAEPVRFEQLFATKTSERASHPVKDLPLQPLLEKIASCR
ncbi:MULTISPECIES: cellulose biosynthesis protein BcsO [Enterobacteriaceae]|uniref:Cellulose biosynthesis protein BcsO n=1 Tax=Leclercia barmai TaxID=2785629 RepID=A0ABS7RVA6_9ENTR|nr:MULTISPECIES: cellulose biosynthesis protein BcsO [Enterobacteriaceae]MBZ0058230.1 cellulose biosynthesis protein BcsO [Leclercia sp. EMC7]MCM5696646.1 cellulose biosynthesis protein BcsO [Leclercia sp. LTM01]MCM5700790.1 cellulose biosynthesis protein BcsO [Leclercia sp. LTM14]TLU67067.1 cellulose biosynthesis protein BcsO [Enterobacter sp. MF024]